MKLAHVNGGCAVRFATMRGRYLPVSVPGGIEFTAADKLDTSSAKAGKGGNAANAWYGFGVPVRNPADIVMTLRNEITELRYAQAHAKRAAHAGTDF